MKTAAYILSLYMLLLAFIPCGDGGGGLDALLHYATGAEHSAAHDHEQHSKDCGDDFCSPFCICNCCSSVLDAPVELSFQIKAPLCVPTGVPVCSDDLDFSSFNSSVWQPPRFS